MKKVIYFISIIFINSVLFFITRKEKNSDIVVAEVTHSIFYTPFYVSIHNGYFEEENLNVKTILTSGADKVTSAVLSGEANIGLSGMEAVLYVYNNNAKDYLVAFSSLTKRDGQFLFGDCKYKDNFNINDLIGKSVLTGRKGGMPSMVFNYALYKNGIDSSKVYLNTSVDFASLSAAYIRGEGDFVNLFEPTASALENEKKGCVLSSIGLLSGEVPYTVFHSKKSFIDNNKEVIEKFTRAITRGKEFVRDNNEEVIANVIKDEFPGNSILEIKNIIKRYKDADSWYFNNSINRDSFNNLIELMEVNGEVLSNVDFNKVVTSYEE